MARKTVVMCDTCGGISGKEFHAFSSRDCSQTFDICHTCQNRIVALVVFGKPFEIRPFCKECKGTGQMANDVDQGDYIAPGTKPCGSCDLWKQPKT